MYLLIRDNGRCTLDISSSAYRLIMVLLVHSRASRKSSRVIREQISKWFEGILKSEKLHPVPLIPFFSVAMIASGTISWLPPWLLGDGKRILTILLLIIMSHHHGSWCHSLVNFWPHVTKKTIGRKRCKEKLTWKVPGMQPRFLAEHSPVVTLDFNVQSHTPSTHVDEASAALHWRSVTHGNPKLTAVSPSSTLKLGTVEEGGAGVVVVVVVEAGNKGGPHTEWNGLGFSTYR